MLTYAKTWHIWDSGIFGTLPWLHPNAYSEPCHIYKKRYIDNPEIFRTLTYLNPDTYSEPSQRFKMECFAKKKLKAIISFPRRSISDLSQGSE